MGGSTSFSGGEVSRTGVLRVFFGFRTSGTGMAIGASSPRQVVNNGAIFILSRTVVGVQVHHLLSVAVVLEEVVFAPFLLHSHAHLQYLYLLLYHNNH